MSSAPRTAGTVWLKRQWQLKENPFPTNAVVRLGGKDRRENGLIYEDGVNAEKFAEATEKFVLGAAFSGLRFGYLWSMSTDPDQQARGFGKSALMQRLAWSLNQDFGKSAYLSCGLDETDAAEVPMCGLLTSFDTTQIRSLSAALFAAVEYAVDFTISDDEPPLAVKLRGRLVARAGADDPLILEALIADQYRKLRGRTLGPPDAKLIAALCDPDPTTAADYLDRVKPATRISKGNNVLATFLLFAAAAGMERVLLCCDQLEDLASPKAVTKAKRELETERFRDVVLETLPMADMLAVIATMHPRAALAIGQYWLLADLPSFEVSTANKHRIVTLGVLSSLGEARRLLAAYLDAARKNGSPRGEADLSPMTSDAVDALFARSNGRPRDILRKAHGLFEHAASENITDITAATVVQALDTVAPEDDIDDPFTGVGPLGAPDWTNG